MLLAHTPVMLTEMLKYLAPKEGGSFLDCTFGAGGYSKAILESCNCKVIAIDLDPNVQEYVNNLVARYEDRFQFIQGNFAAISSIIKETKFDGIVADLGVSSMQLDIKSRGFSFASDGPLDMRMSSVGMDAASFVANASEADIADVIYHYGEEPAARKIARSIVSERIIEPIVSTARLAKIVRNSIGFRKSKIDLATKTFQAIRIYINDELGQLKALLDESLKLLNANGRLVVVSFHSLEDKIVKDFFKDNAPKSTARSKYAKKLVEDHEQGSLRILTKKPLSPSRNEVLTNPRSRSAKLRAAQKTGVEDDYTSI